MYKFLINLLIIALPVMFYINVGTRINVSVADFVLPLLFLYQIIYQKDTGLSKEKPILIYSYTIIFVMFLSLLVASYSGNLNDLTSGLTNILKITINFIYAIVFFKFLKDSERNDLLFLKIWSITATIFAIMGIIGVILYYSGKATIFSSEYRLDGTFNDPNLAALYLYISLIFNQIYCYKYLKKKISINSFIIFLALILTVSRGGILSLFIAILFSIILYLPQLKLRKIIYILLISSGLLLSVFLAYEFFNNDLINTIITRLQSVNTEDTSIKYRFLLWDTAIRLWIEHPLFGVGSGQYSTVASNLLGYKITDIPHNSYFGFLAEGGIVGFFAFAWLPTVFLIKLIRMMKNEDIISLYLLVGLLSIFIQALTINIENIRIIWIVFAYIHYWYLQSMK